ncbi:hypothetical protein AVEN_146322-1 [Araneus ventricosus]|uniref:Uncharacterized protein n=1 Tax=Araneus ventricosus TaxID=182803 RepID=A0A4Y2U3Z4_ARAVE|nr:hypothetical protein AVEN_108149-1 [Araneus ventricosus]GBO06329.1 hypothetical protein AVEN_146322-1 [Araneus ventricosus]
MQKFRIRYECIVFRAELLCISLIVKWFKENEATFSQYVICSDSLSSLFSLLTIKRKERLVMETLVILRILKDNHMDIFFTHIKGHCGIPGNERAEFLAKDSHNMPFNINFGIPKCHWKRPSHQKLLRRWEEEYASSSKASHTKQFFPTVKYRLERNSFFFCSFKVTEFLTGHCNFGEYLKRFHRQTSDCSAREIQSVEHIMFRCLHV